MAWPWWRPVNERESHVIDEEFPLPVQLIGAGAIAQTDQIVVNGLLVTPVKNFANVAASQTDQVLLAATVGRKIRMVYYLLIAGDTATNVTFNSKGSGAGTAISSLKALAINGGAVASLISSGWFETKSGEALTISTGAGSTVGIDYATILV